MLVFLRLGMLREVKRVVGFPKIFWFDPGSSIKVLSIKMEKMFSLEWCDLTWQS